MHNWLNILTLLAPGVEHNVPPVQKWQDSAYLGAESPLVNISKFKYVHDGQFGTI